eukprot:6211155-Pleurochrysis_carterae.AAC.2
MRKLLQQVRAITEVRDRSARQQGTRTSRADGVRMASAANCVERDNGKARRRVLHTWHLRRSENPCRGPCATAWGVDEDMRGRVLRGLLICGASLYRVNRISKRAARRPAGSCYRSGSSKWAIRGQLL